MKKGMIARWQLRLALRVGSEMTSPRPREGTRSLDSGGGEILSPPTTHREPHPTMPEAARNPTRIDGFLKNVGEMTSAPQTRKAHQRVEVQTSLTGRPAD
jgi:hypothetical protein